MPSPQGKYELVYDSLLLDQEDVRDMYEITVSLRQLAENPSARQRARAEKMLKVWEGRWKTVTHGFEFTKLCSSNNLYVLSGYFDNSAPSASGTVRGMIINKMTK